MKQQLAELGLALSPVDQLLTATSLSNASPVAESKAQSSAATPPSNSSAAAASSKHGLQSPVRAYCVEISAKLGTNVDVMQNAMLKVCSPRAL